jgi:hypothetical protein
MIKCTLLIYLFLLSLSCFLQNQGFLSKPKAIADINYLCKTIQSVHYDAFFKIEEESFLNVKDSILQTWTSDSVKLKDFISTGMKLAALMSGGHTSMDWKHRDLFPELMSHEFIPLKIKKEGKGMYLITESASSDIKSGQQILAIIGENISSIFSEIKSYFGGLPDFKNIQAEKLFPLYLFFNDKIKAPYQLTLADNSKISIEKNLSAEEINQFLSTQSYSENYTFNTLEDDIAYIAYNSCEGYNEFDLFLQKTFKEIYEKKLNKLIIDIRKNGGGASDLNDLLLSYISSKNTDNLLSDTGK